MTQTAIFWPMLGHVLLVFVVYVVLGRRRYAAVSTGAAKPAEYRQRASEPEYSMTAANNLMNQFEAPVLFHVFCLALHAIGAVSVVPLVLGWLFVVSRYAHAFVHLTTNKLKHRNYSFRAGVVLLALMWLWFALAMAGLV